MIRTRRPRIAGLVALLCAALSASTSRSEPGDLITYVPLPTIAPQDLVRDEDGTWWVTALLDNTIRRYSSDFTTQLDVIPSPFPANTYLTGIALNTLDDTLLVAVASGGSIIELAKDGSRTGLEIPLALEPVVNPNGFPTVRGLAFYEMGDGGAGSVFVVESLGTLIYEFALDGRVLRTFPHPEDPDGFPGSGASANAADIELVRDATGTLSGFYLTGLRGDERRVLVLEADGSYTGIAVSMSDAGGNVSGIARHEIPDPLRAGATVDAWVVVVESNARVAVLEGGAPEFREIFDLACTADGQRVSISWTRLQVYERIEIRKGCEVFATLPGDADAWSTELETAGVFALSVHVVGLGSSMETAPCTIVIGPGQARSAVEFEAELPIDLAWDGDAYLFVTDAFEHRLLAFDRELVFQGDVLLTDEVATGDEAVTGVARGDLAETLFVYNNSRASLLRINYFGEVLESITPDLPNLAREPAEGEEPPEPDYGVVIGMSFDPTGDGGRGSLWMMETAADAIHELRLDGSRLRSFAHPYRDRVAAPEAAGFSIYSSALARVPGSEPTRLLLSGGSITDFGQRFFFELDTSTGAIVRGSEFPAADATRLTGTRSFSAELVPSADGATLVVLPLFREPALVAIENRLSAIRPPAVLACRQQSEAPQVELAIEGGGPFDAIEVLRDCSLHATLPGDTRVWVDEDVPPGFRHYAVRGVRAGDRSASAECGVAVGAGAILQRAFTWPARSPQQIARDPVDGSYWVVVDWPGDERKLYHFDAELRFIALRDSVLEAPWKISSLAIRVDESGERQIFLIAWQQPIQPSSAGRETFYLASETLEGLPIASVELDPPRPTNGFVTFPSALSWDPVSDTFWYLERNTKHLVRIDTAGSTLALVPHPAPPFQNFVFNLGLAVVPERGTIWVSTAERRDHRITKAIEVTFAGEPTGAEIRFDTLPEVVRGFAYGRESLFVTSPGSLPRILRIKLFPEVPAPFVRGDGNSDGAINLTDAINVLEHLFLGRTGRIACADAADADDDGRLTITDPIVVLGHLFHGGQSPRPPYPEAGHDPTADALDCQPALPAR